VKKLTEEREATISYFSKVRYIFFTSFYP